MESTDGISIIYQSYYLEHDLKEGVLYRVDNDYHFAYWGNNYKQPMLHDSAYLTILPVRNLYGGIDSYTIAIPDGYDFWSLTVGPDWVDWTGSLMSWEKLEFQRTTCKDGSDNCFCIYGKSQQRYVRGWENGDVDTVPWCQGWEKWKFYRVNQLYIY